MVLIVSICVAISVFILVRFTTPVVSAALETYGDKLNTNAVSSLTDMFIFIEPKQIAMLMAGSWMVSFFVSWLVTGVWPLALMISALGAYFPQFAIKFLKKRRIDRFLQDLPDALLGVANMLKAGSNLSMALETLVEEMAGPISQEFGLLLREIRVGVPIDDALDNLYKRMPVAELQLVVAGMKISREVGGSLAEVLARLADTIRRRLEMEGKIKSLTAQGKMQGVVMSALPIFIGYLLYHIEPQAMSHLFTDYVGWGVCAVMVVGEYIGYYFIKKIVTIDV